MKLWVSLYGLIWLVFVEIWLGYTPLAPPVPLYLHIALGVVILGVAWRNYVALRDTTTVGRIKRTAKATVSLSVLMALLGVLIYFGIGDSLVVAWGISVGSGLRFLHFVNAIAILSQVSATAVVYDVWEEKEFATPAPPGEVPAPPVPGK